MQRENTIIFKRCKAPCGSLLIGSLGDRLCLCDWENGWHQKETESRLRIRLNADFTEGTSPIIEQTIIELEEYFRGERQNFDIPMLLAGTDFQMQVWETLKSIPYGETISYGEEAARMGKPKSVRAVANANGRNAISILIPCHRVIGSNGKLTGYGGGMKAKEWLLKNEMIISVQV